MASLSRRAFLGTTLAGVGALATASVRARPLGANGDIRLAVFGVNGRGGDHLKEFGRIKGVRITHLVDPDTRTFAKRLKQLETLKLSAAETEQNPRKALDNKEIDAISIATPNHWHSLLTIWGCQAGKDVYCEKPCSQNLHEGKIAVAAAQKYDRIVQHGTQRRSQASWWRMLDLVKSGTYGKLLVSRAIIYKKRTSIGIKPVTPAPAELDFDMWNGPAPKHEFHANLVPYNWHWFWDFGNGDIGNQGVHQLDVARWMIPGAGWPKSAVSIGGRLGYTDQGETPNTQVAVYDYGPTKLICEVRGLPSQDYRGIKESDNALEFEAGIVSGGKFYPKGKAEGEPLAKGTLPDDEEVKKPDAGVFQNWVNAIRSRKADSLHAHIREGHISSGVCHLGNVSYRLGHTGLVTPEALGGGAAVAETLERLETHLSRGKLSLKTTPMTLGKVVTFDPETESFGSDKAANALVSRPMREPYAVPERL